MTTSPGRSVHERFPQLLNDLPPVGFEEHCETSKRHFEEFDPASCVEDDVENCIEEGPQVRPEVLAKITCKRDRQLEQRH